MAAYSKTPCSPCWQACSFSVHRYGSTSGSSRVVFAAWMAACFSLAAYTQSLLTASAMAGARWEADDTLDKIYPKLETGELLPCVVAHTYFALWLREAGLHHRRQRNLIDAMAAAAARLEARTSADDVVALDHMSCLEKVTKGTHMYLTVTSDLCLYVADSKDIAKGKEVLTAILGGFPMRNDYSFRKRDCLAHPPGVRDRLGNTLEEEDVLELLRNISRCKCESSS
ncbi:hypothetical protein HPB51_001768 [Rhipicephalus microplus]|uniref:Uncharacterized protein n=1 Tax=Rhipicephalus microplus TaxID=6941 RepID=A0A9J6DRP2_RHIMP|nr:hypothetical protein HPB51_001768 [Rhipicephalus microplus]